MTTALTILSVAVQLLCYGVIFYSFLQLRKTNNQYFNDIMKYLDLMRDIMRCDNIEQARNLISLRLSDKIAPAKDISLEKRKDLH